MYVPAYARLPAADAATLAREHPFAAFCSELDGAPFVTHLPLLAEEAGGEWWLRGHVARANPHWRGWDGERAALAVFRGPHAYVSPRWYTQPGEVPTWNYLAAHASGKPLAVHDADWLRGLMSRLAERFDPEWAACAPTPEESACRERLLGGVVGVEMRVEAWTGKAKLGQNKSAADRIAAAAGLTATRESAAAAVARRMRGVAP